MPFPDSEYLPVITPGGVYLTFQFLKPGLKPGIAG